MECHITIDFSPRHITAEIRETSHPTSEEMESCPEHFRCYVCDQKRPAKHVGGLLAFQWVCKFCYPFVDGRFVEAIRRFDNRRNKPHFFSTKPPEPKGYVIPEEAYPIWYALWSKGEELPETEKIKIREKLEKANWEKHWYEFSKHE